MGNLTETLARQVVLKRHARGWTQEELADRARLSARYIGQLERYKASPSVDVLERLATAFGVPPAELLRPIKTKRKR
jgi:transcriptional regulator with XRE-family HTH domain